MKTPIPPLLRRVRPIHLAVAVLLSMTSAGFAQVKYTHAYEANTLPAASTPVWQELKGGESKAEGTAVVSGGKLRVEVPENARHYYAIGTSGGGSERGAGVAAYNGNAEAGTTIDFRVTVTGEDPKQEIFGIHIGRDNGRATVTFAPSGIWVNGRFVEHSTTEPDTYRIAFNNDAFSFYSAKKGKLYEGELRAAENYPHNALFVGTLASMDLKTPGSWELDFIKWTQEGAEFSVPK